MTIAEIAGYWSDRYLNVFMWSFGLSLLLTFISIHLLPRLGIMDKPDPRKIHLHPIPRMGGVGIYLAFVAPMLMMMYFDKPQEGIILGSGIVLVIGAADDIWGVPAWLKLLGLFGATFLMSRFGVISSLPFHYLGLSDYWCNLVLTMLWVAGLCSAINALDHMDGLAGGIAVIAAFSYLAVSIQTEQYFWGLLSVALMGSLMGFLFFNRHPAKIFMGDSGSFFLGYSLASIGIMGGWSIEPVKAAIVPLAILSVPLFDILYVLVARRLDGTTKSIIESITYCGKDHIGHRLCRMGFGQVGAVRLVYLLAISVSISALTIRNAGFEESLMLLLQIALIYVILIIVMKKFEKLYGKDKVDAPDSNK
ncbi:MAG: hypothetical protein A2X49_15285 [Lentisphaerae bacterium GWF2_52_8]|nr:MAG: hypothetical protein A2X49_15285 [Lentisphaerae bacterium GWF2_52_8]